MQNYSLDYLLLVQSVSSKAAAALEASIDERMLALITDPLDFPPHSIDALKTLEEKALEKYDEHLRKI